MAEGSLVLKGVIDNVVFYNSDNDYAVLEIVDENELLIIAVGNMSIPFEGERVALYGKWGRHKEFGKQFCFDSYEKTLPCEVEGILQYLSSRAVKGIGPITARKIVERFGVDSFDIIENHPEWLTDISGITMKKAAQISQSFVEQSGLRNISMALKDYITSAEAVKVYKKYGPSAMGMVRGNPYLLCSDECGIPFVKVDLLARSLGVDPESKNRIFSGITYILQHNANINGHTCLPIDKLVDDTSKLLGVCTDKISSDISVFISDGSLCEFTANYVKYVMTKKTSESEEYVVKKIRQLTSQIIRFSASDVASIIQNAEAHLNIQYAVLQREALFASVNNSISILTGGPGTGKTTVVKGMLDVFKQMELKAVLCAPTGRAAKRLSEATGQEAKTIHRLLEMERTAEEESRFNRNERAPLDENVIIVDEASMIDLVLLEALMRAMRRGSRLILIGDSDQLPSVGAGNILADLIGCGAITVTRLNEIFRQSAESLIVMNAHSINEGIAPVLNVVDSDFFFVQRENETEISATISDLITRRLPKVYGEDITEGIQVISPSKKGFGGVEILNRELQEKINPPTKFKKEKRVHDTLFREGDKVMQVANNYDIEWEKNGIVGNGIFNGDIGYIDSIDFTEEIFNIWFEDKLVRYSFDDLDDLALSYAITVHKSQGSEYPVVIVPMYNCHPMLMTRNLLYTAITRAKKMVVLVGKSEIPSLMTSNNREIIRYTTLSDRIRQGLA